MDATTGTHQPHHTVPHKKPFYKRWWFILLVILFLIGIANSGSDSGSSTTDTTQTQTATQSPDAYYLGDRIVSNGWAYTVHSYETSKYIGESEYFREEATGMFVIFDVTIENVGKESRTLWSSNIQVIDDQDRTFEHDTTAELYLPSNEQFTFEQMQPGLPKRGKIVFDVPENIKGSLVVGGKPVSWKKKE